MLASNRAGHVAFEDTRGLGSMPIIADWKEWWREWAPKIAAQEGRQGWIIFLLDANDRIQEVTMTLSRIIRSKPAYDTTGWSEDEWSDPRLVADRAAAWFKQHAPVNDMPEWAQFVAAAQWGNLSVLRRVARELSALKAQGYTTVLLEQTDPNSLPSVLAGGEVLLREQA